MPTGWIIVLSLLTGAIIFCLGVLAGFGLGKVELPLKDDDNDERYM